MMNATGCKTFHFIVFISCVIFFLNLSCNKKFDAPPLYIPPDITPNTTIVALKALHNIGNADAILTDRIIAGVVIANDASGNFYKQIILQDSTGGIAVNIDDYNLYTSFPLGRKVYVKLNGLYINDDGGLPYLGATPDAGGKLAAIPSRLKDQYLIKGELQVPVVPKVVTVFDLKSDNDLYAYTVVTLNNFEVKEGDTSKTYANAVNKTDASIIVKNCAGDTLVMRTSGFAAFAGIPVPNGNGNLTAVYVYYKSPYNSRITPQVMIRDTADVPFTSTRCDGLVPVNNSQLISIKELRAKYAGTDLRLGAYKIGGVVITDALNKNVSGGSVALQDGSRGISVYFGGMVTYNVGDSIVLDVTGDSLINYRGSLEIKTPYGTPKPAPVATNVAVNPTLMTIQELKDSLPAVEFTLITIKEATAVGSAFYSGSQMLTDATGNVVLYTSPAATFASSLLPAGANDWTGYVSFYNADPQFQIRNTGDVTNGTPPQAGDSDLLISEYIEGSAGNKFLEVYNAGAANADLARYHLKLFANGNTAPDSKARLDSATGLSTLLPGGVLVFSSTTANLSLPAGVTAYPISVCNFNGNDALTLEKNNEVIDVFGAVGTDPGTSWTIAGDNKAAVDKTVRRKAGVIHGNTGWSTSAAHEWIVINAVDDVSNLGARE